MIFCGIKIKIRDFFSIFFFLNLISAIFYYRTFNILKLNIYLINISVNPADLSLDFKLKLNLSKIS